MAQLSRGTDATATMTAPVTATAVSGRRSSWSRWQRPRQERTPTCPEAPYERASPGLLILVSWVRIPPGSPRFHGEDDVRVAVIHGGGCRFDSHGDSHGARSTGNRQSAESAQSAPDYARARLATCCCRRFTTCPYVFVVRGARRTRPAALLGRPASRSGSAAEQHRVHPHGHLLLSSLEHVAVGVRGEHDGAVPQQVLDVLEPEALTEQERRRGMAQVVETAAR